jgi:hypothetical protein
MKHAAVSRREAAKRTAPAQRRVSCLGVIILAAGGLATSTAAVATLAKASGGSGTAVEAVLGTVSAEELEATAPSLDPSVAMAAIADAKSCKAPLAAVLLWRSASVAPGDTVRIRSGSYLSPPFKVAAAAERIAIPYPAPYATGRGVITVLGDGPDYSVALTPVTRIADLAGSRSIQVVWQPKSPC